MASWITQIITDLGYVGIALLMLLEAVFPPIPSELIVPFAGFAAGQGELNFVGVIVAATIGSLVGMLPWYFVGRLFGLERVKWLADRIGRWFAFNADEIDYAARIFDRWGKPIVLVGRLFPILRTLISVPAGLAKMNFATFALFSAIGMLIWNTVLVSAGYLLHEHYHLVESWLDPLTWLVLVVVVGLYVFRLFTWRPSRASQKI
ncbi:MAG TPA: DedA family protein [Devosia sp.]|jgi:membrane protein DedA with SNARE-associated domain|uniref:DedA family protein n=1 Tax=Devosia sp. TaxID=1871048 RepID=UPI002DDD14BB|nr:DedA family protein [Devosia sp.]HEV2516919.1 DedA family protein [Devosia sp.]